MSITTHTWATLAWHSSREGLWSHWLSTANSSQLGNMGFISMTRQSQKQNIQVWKQYTNCVTFVYFSFYFLYRDFESDLLPCLRKRRVHKVSFTGKSSTYSTNSIIFYSWANNIILSWAIWNCCFSKSKTVEYKQFHVVNLIFCCTPWE